MHRCRTTLAPIRTGLAVAGAAIALIGCTSGSEAVPVPEADEVVTTPVVSVELPPVIDTGSTDGSVTDAVDDPAPTIQPAPASSTPAPIDTPAPDTAADPQPETTAAAPATDAESDDVFFRLGDQGAEVGKMQLKLSVLGYLPAGSDSGIFDQATETGLRQFQTDYGLGVDGVFGPLTGRSLNAAAQSVSVEG